VPVNIYESQSPLILRQRRCSWLGYPLECPETHTKELGSSRHDQSLDPPHLPLTAAQTKHSTQIFFLDVLTSGEARVAELRFACRENIRVVPEATPFLCPPIPGRHRRMRRPLEG
jgi:predicted RNA-binding Zn-ribbon protein involved in translation (DUF1610 family)